MRQEMQRLADVCGRLQMHKQAELCLNWIGVDRPDQHRFYLPGQIPEVTKDDNYTRWREHFLAARRRYAEYLFEQAQQNASVGRSAVAFRLLWQVLREDPDHSRAKQVLGPLATATQSRPRQRSGGNTPPELSRLGSFQRWQSPHFQVWTRADAKSSQATIELMEQFYAVWSQCFYDQWAPADVLQTRLAKVNQSWPEMPSIQVVILADREDYLKLLGVEEKNIGVSVGYYSPKAKRSFFYPSADLQETLFHELTHQLFSEVARWKGDIAHRKADVDLEHLQGAWAIEGIALYMESLRPAAEGWTVGGIESSRLQTARYRALRDQHWPPWSNFCQGTIAQWKQQTGIALSYAHAAGLTHTLLDLATDGPTRAKQPLNDASSDSNGAEIDSQPPIARTAFLDYLASVYQGQPDHERLLKILGQDDQQAQDNYRNLLTVRQEQLVAVENPSIQQLVLTGSRLEDWAIVGRYRSLQWLDLSFSNLKPDQADWLSNLQHLNRLSLEGNPVNQAILLQVSKLPRLSELDLSLCPIQDKDLESLAQHPALESLWLTGTQVTEASFDLLKSLPKLKHCEVSSTAISEEAWQQFTQSHPQLQASLP